MSNDHYLSLQASPESGRGIRRLFWCVCGWPNKSPCRTLGKPGLSGAVFAATRMSPIGALRVGYCEVVICPVLGTKRKSRSAVKVQRLTQSARLSSSIAAMQKDHSITSSARTSNVGGTVRLSAIAVLRLITNSNCVGSTIGRSARFWPSIDRP